MINELMNLLGVPSSTSTRIQIFFRSPYCSIILNLLHLLTRNLNNLSLGVASFMQKHYNLEGIFFSGASTIKLLHKCFKLLCSLLMP
jgi:hypothetical protein